MQQSLGKIVIFLGRVSGFQSLSAVAGRLAQRACGGS
jgi:hypothetical protein